VIEELWQQLKTWHPDPLSFKPSDGWLGQAIVLSAALP
jgi:hypothetical protein